MATNENYRALLAQGLADASPYGEVAAPDLQGYRIERKLGQGGMGSVYLAVDTALERRVALKIFDTGNMEPASLERFQQESRMMAKIDHPNVVGIFGVISDGDEAGSPLCLVLEYVPGGDLADRMSAPGKISTGEVVRIAMDVCDGLSAIHSQGIIHRDLKPANILLTEGGRAKVADLGIAVDGVSETLTMTGSYLGSMAYVSPEQMTGNRREVDARADIWALGVVLFQLLTGETPQASLEADPMKGIPREFRGILGKCLARNPKERFSSAAEVKDRLAKVKLGAGPRWKVYAGLAAGLVLSSAIFMAFRNEGNPDLAAEDAGEVREVIGKMPEPAVADDKFPADEGLEIDLIGLLVNPVDADAGAWLVDEGALRCDAAEGAACVSFPVDERSVLGGSYDVSVNFTRETGGNSLAVFLPTAVGTVTFDLDGWNNGSSGIQNLDGQNLKQHSQVFTFGITNGRPYQLLIQVRPDVIRIHIDGSLVHTCVIEGRKGSVIELWGFPRKHGFSVGAWASRMTFRRLTLKKVSD